MRFCSVTIALIIITFTICRTKGKMATNPIYVGSGFGAWVNTRTLIHHNLLERAKAEGEIIGLKTSLNDVIGNTAIQAGGYFSNRLGHGNVWKNNWLERH